MSKTAKTTPYWAKVANAPEWAKKPWHRPTCDGNCGIEKLNAAELFALSNKPSCYIFLVNSYVVPNKTYSKGTHCKWGVNSYIRKERAKVRVALGKMRFDPEMDEPEPYRGRNRNKWDMS